MKGSDSKAIRLMKAGDQVEVVGLTSAGEEISSECGNGWCDLYMNPLLPE
jgi:hypothetical protein